MRNQPPPPDNDPPRPYSDVLAEAIDILTEAAHLTRTGGSGSPDGDGNRVDFGEFVTLAVAATAANVGGVTKLLAGRPGSWEADSVRNMLHSTIGDDEQHLVEHRTVPLVVTVAVDNILDDLGYTAVYDEAEAELLRREDAIAWPSDGDDATAQEAEQDRINGLRDRLDQLRASDWTAYGEAFQDQVLAAAAELYPTMTVPVEVVIESNWQPEEDAGNWWGPADQLLSTARERTPLPGSGIAPRGYTSEGLMDLASTERAEGRDPLARLDRP